LGEESKRRRRKKVRSLKKQRKERKHENLRNEIVREKRVGGDFSYRLYETKKMGLQKCARGLLSGRIFLDRLYETKKLPPKKMHRQNRWKSICL